MEVIPQKERQTGDNEGLLGSSKKGSVDIDNAQSPRPVVDKTPSKTSTYLLGVILLVAVPIACGKRMFAEMETEKSKEFPDWSMDIGGLAIPQLTFLIVAGINMFVFLVLEVTLRTSAAPADFVAPDPSAKRVNPVDWSFGQIYLLTRNFAVFSVLMFYAYLCERHPPNPHGNEKEIINPPSSSLC